VRILLIRGNCTTCRRDVRKARSTACWGGNRPCLALSMEGDVKSKLRFLWHNLKQKKRGAGSRPSIRHHAGVYRRAPTRFSGPRMAPARP
jgi:hypothetical protein